MGLAQRMTTAEFDMAIPTYRGMFGQILDAIADRDGATGEGDCGPGRQEGHQSASKGFFRFAENVGRDVSNPDRLVLLDEQASRAYDEHRRCPHGLGAEPGR